MSCSSRDNIATMEGHRHYESKWSYRLPSVHNSRQIKHFSGSGDSSTSNGVGGSESGKQAAADSLHKVMYLNCWIQS